MLSFIFSDTTKRIFYKNRAQRSPKISLIISSDSEFRQIRSNNGALARRTDRTNGMTEK